ncbi:MAG: DMT family transporter, partial [Alphaproteobacteria bacterium]
MKSSRRPTPVGIDSLRRLGGAVEGRWLRLAPNARGALWTLANCATSTVLVVLVKLVGETIPSFEIVFFRNLFGLALILPVALRMGRRATATARLPLHLARGALSFVNMSCFYYAFSHLPLADATAFSFTMPLFLIGIAALALGEKVRWRRTAATVVGFAGVLVMLRPGQGVIQTAALMALSMGLLDALGAVVIKKLALTERLVTMLLYLGLVTTAASTVPAYLVWVQPSTWDLVLLGLITLVTTVSQAFGIFAWRAGEATAIAPFN